MKKQATMREIAEALQTSVVTVSNALAGKKGVGDELRRRILEKGAELGYDIPAEEKRADEKVVTLGIISSRWYMSEGSSFYWEMYQNTIAAATRRNALTMLKMLDDEEKLLDEEEEEEFLSSLLTSKNTADGFIVIGRIGDGLMKRILRNVKEPVVLLDFYRPGYGCDAVLSNNYMGACRITEYLIDRGHREIGFVGTGRTSRNVVERYYGFCRCMRGHGLPVVPEWLLEDRGLRTETPRLILPEKLPTAFVCSSDYSAGLLYNELLGRGLRVPEDISVIGYDDYLYGNTFAERLTSYHVDMEEMAREAVQMVLQRMSAPRRPYRIRYVDSGIVERASVRCIYAGDMVKAEQA